MKPRNKREREIVSLSETLNSLYKQEQWAKHNLFNHEAYKCKDEIWCSDCANTWKITDTQQNLNKASKVECPHCQSKLSLKVSRKQKNEEIKYMTVAETCNGYQVFRHVYCLRFTRKKDALINYFFKEVVQEWISQDGKRTIMAIPMNTGRNGWLYSEKLSIKNEFGSSYYHSNPYDFAGDCAPHPDLLPFLKKRGLNREILDRSRPAGIVKALLENKGDVELCIKTKQFSMLRFLNRNQTTFIRSKKSFNICNRNNYIIKDASLWEDYLELLRYFHKDLHNAHYVCPHDLKAEHDKLENRKRKLEHEAYVKRQIKDMHEWETNYQNNKSKFFAINLEKSNIKIKVLQSVDEFKEEGDKMHHCVFSNRYFNKDDALILSARDMETNKRIETIEVNLKSYQVIQSRGTCNINSPQHELILELVKNNIIPEIIKINKKPQSVSV